MSVVSSQDPMTIVFADNHNGTLEWSGEVVQISRFLWAWSDAVDQLAGNWLLTLVENGMQVSQLVSIEDAGGNGYAEVNNMITDAAVGTVELIDGDLVMTLAAASESALPLVMPESGRFYAGFTDADSLQVVAVRLDDMPIVISSNGSEEPKSALEQFTSNVTISSDGGTLTIDSDGLPNHPSPYWGQGHPNFEPPHMGMFVNPNLIEEQNLTFRIPAQPEIASTPSDTSLGPIGVSINGVPLFNQYAGVNMVTGEFLPLENEIESFDIYNGHPQQTGQYHYHFEPVYLTVADNAAFIGFGLDGFPVYGPRNPDDSALDLDECNGETHVTPEYPEGIYHYHVTSVEPYIMGCYRGTPGTWTD